MRRTVLLLFLAALVPVSDAQEAAGGDLDLRAMRREARRVLERDLASWESFSFQRHVMRQRLDSGGEVDWQQELEFRVTPSSDGFDEELVRIDGKPPSAREVASHRKAARFTRHYREQIVGRVDGEDFEEGFSMRTLLEAYRYEYGGQETVNGVLCHRLEVLPAPAGGEQEVERLAEVTEGVVHVSVDGLHVVRGETRITRGVKRGAVKLKELELLVETAPVGEVWLPRIFEVYSVASAVVKTLRKQNRWTYSDFARSVGD